jgi:sugar (pentulose or hexulose) kinase
VAEYFLGLDFGTSGARACVLDKAGEQVFESRAGYANATEPRHWREALYGLIAELPIEIRSHLAALAIDGTSGTLLATNVTFGPVSPALLYNDARADAEAQSISNAQFGATSGLAKRLWLAQHFPDAAFCFHQADWLAALLTGKPGFSDYHNALKFGYDPQTLQWPDWVTALPGGRWQQTVLVPGEEIGGISTQVATRFNLNPACVVRAGTTDSIAAFIASGASRPGEAVTSLGTTLVLKLLSENRVEDPASGVYSHRFGKLWLAGGASNSGGGVLRQFFSDTQLAALSKQIKPDQPSGLDYYPLPRPGERFPINDPALPPRLQPRPVSDVQFLQGLLEGMANIEALGYRKLIALGATPLSRVLTAGGGAKNSAWQTLRQARLGVPVSEAKQGEAAFGAALLALHGSDLYKLQGI